MSSVPNEQFLNVSPTVFFAKPEEVEGVLDTTVLAKPDEVLKGVFDSPFSGKPGEVRGVVCESCSSVGAGSGSSVGFTVFDGLLETRGEVEIGGFVAFFLTL